MSIDEELQAIQERYDEAIQLSDARIQRILDRIDTLRPAPKVWLTVDAPARIIDGRHKSEWRQPDAVHIGLSMEFRYNFPVTESRLYHEMEVKFMGVRRLKTLNADANVINGDTVGLVYRVITGAYPASPENTLYDSVILI